MPRPASASEWLRVEADGGRRVQVLALRHEPVVVAVRARPAGSTQLLRRMPAASAAATEHTITAADWSTVMLAFWYFVYGYPM